MSNLLIKCGAALIAVGLTASLTDAATNGGRSPWKPMTCVPKGARFSLCGSGSTTRLTAGFQIRFMELLPNGKLVQRGAAHASCASAMQDRALPRAVRRNLAANCKASFSNLLKLK
jgi:hypothetical protein